MYLQKCFCADTMYDVYLSKWELDLVTSNFEGWQLHYRICVACYLCDFMCARVRECVCAFVSMCACVWVIAQHQLVHRFVIPPICKCCSTWDSCINLVVMLEILIFFSSKKKHSMIIIEIFQIFFFLLLHHLLLLRGEKNITWRYFDRITEITVVAISPKQ